MLCSQSVVFSFVFVDNSTFSINSASQQIVIFICFIAQLLTQTRIEIYKKLHFHYNSCQFCWILGLSKKTLFFTLVLLRKFTIRALSQGTVSKSKISNFRIVFAASVAIGFFSAG